MKNNGTSACRVMPRAADCLKTCIVNDEDVMKLSGCNDLYICVTLELGKERVKYDSSFFSKRGFSSVGGLG